MLNTCCINLIALGAYPCSWVIAGALAMAATLPPARLYDERRQEWRDEVDWDARTDGGSRGSILPIAPFCQVCEIHSPHAQLPCLALRVCNCEWPCEAREVPCRRRRFESPHQSSASTTPRHVITLSEVECV